MKYAVLETNHTPTLIFSSFRAKQKQENYYTTFAGDAIALSMCNKPLSL